MSRKLTTHLLTLADEDDFHTTLHILLTSHPSQINLNRRTSSGDYLITLAAFAACERATESKTRINALKCLIFVLDRDFTAVNKVAADGGSALHCALAAASCFEEFEGGDDDDDSRDDDDDDDDDDCSQGSNEEDFNEEEEEDQKTDTVYLNELRSKAVQESLRIDGFYPELKDLSSDEIVVVTVQLLLSYEADVNLPIANINDLSYEECDEDSDDDLELAFSRESIIEQWTPLMLALQMVILVCKESAESNQNRSLLASSILIVQLLVHANADSSYMMAASTTGEWNSCHILNSAFHHLGFIKMNSQVMDTVTLLQEKVVQYLNPILDEEMIYVNLADDLNHDGSIYDCIDSIIYKSAKERHLTPIQCFVSATMKNDVQLATSIVEDFNDSHLQRNGIIEKWRSLKFSTIFPMLQSVWDEEQHSSMTVLDVVAYLNAADSLIFLIFDDPLILSERELKNCIKFALTRHTRDCSPHNVQLLSKSQRHTLQVLLRRENDENPSDRTQRVLDMLLVECCRQTQWAQNSTMNILLQFGADPNIASIQKNVKDALTPIHLIAGNHRGDDGIVKVDLLMGKREKGCNIAENGKKFEYANLVAMTSESNRLPLTIALEKKNYHVAKHLYEAMTNMNVGVDRMEWDIQQAYLLGEAAIECTSLNLFESTIDIMKIHMTVEDVASPSRALGKLLLLVLDERSGFGRKLMAASRNEELHHKLSKIINIVSDVHEEHPKLTLYPWCQDDVSRHNPLHHLLRNDRGSSLRKLLLHPLCTLLSRDDDRNTSTQSIKNAVSLPCDKKFGLYTPLHLACALGCEDSVKTLLQFGADTEALADDKKKPIELIPDQFQFSIDVMTILST